MVSTLLADQVGRAESLNATDSAIAGLGGVVTTLAGLVPSLTRHQVGLAGVAAAGISVVAAVVGLMVRRPGRDPVEPGPLLEHILHTDDVALIEEVLLYADVAAATRNDGRLRAKSRWTMTAAGALAAAMILIVVAIIGIDT